MCTCPAVMSYRSQWGIWPTLEQAEWIVAKVTDMTRWEAAMKVWSVSGYAAKNVFGQLEWYDKGKGSTTDDQAKGTAALLGCATPKLLATPPFRQKSPSIVQNRRCGAEFGVPGSIALFDPTIAYLTA